MIGVIDTGAGNVTSLRTAIERTGRRTAFLRTPTTDGIDQLVIPGQGRFGRVMAALAQNGWRTALREWIEADRKVLGICVGLQILFAQSDEDPGVEGLAVMDGRVVAVDGPKRPMVGWAPVDFRDDTPSGTAYFVNGFAVPPCRDTVAETAYGTPFSAVIARGNVIAAQFHPEKSGAYGRELLERWLA